MNANMLLPTPEPQVVVVNESTHLSSAQAWNLAWVLEYQTRWQFAPLWKSLAAVSLLPAGKPIPADTWVLHLLDSTDQQGALGYHDEDGKEVPYSRVFVETAMQNGLQPSEVASHELLEMLVDPHVNATQFDPKSGRLNAYEVCDPCQGFAYDLGAPYGRKTGWIVADFVLPSYFDPNSAATDTTDYRAGLKGPFSLGAQGYVSYATQLPPNWQQQMGEHAQRGVVDADDRVSRRR